jgi:glucose-6-phosphate isomerase
MKWVEPSAFAIDVAQGAMQGTASCYRKQLKDMGGQYADMSAFEAMAAVKGEQVVYEVTDHKPSARAGDVITGVTRMVPGHVGGEFFMTRGHIHQVADRPEMYFCLSGKGVMLMESPDGETRCLEMPAHTVCYVPPYWIHRSVNVGSVDFVMLFCYPADSGQDYDIIARSHGMRHRVVQDPENGWALVENKNYRFRDTAEWKKVCV